jgi:DNA-binding NtrC family response regulator
MERTPRIVYLMNDTSTAAVLHDNLHRHAIVASAGSIEETLNILAGGVVDVVLCDWNFPGGTWREALGKLRARRPDLPVIVVSGTRGVEEATAEWIEVLRDGAFDLLLNPLSNADVSMALERAVTSGANRAIGSTA